MARRVTGDADPQGGFGYSFQFQRPVDLPLLPLEQGGSLLVGSTEPLLDPLFHFRISDHDKIPRLHEADAGGMMRRIQNSGENLLRDRFRQKLAPDVTSAMDRFIDCVTFCF